VVVVAVLVLAVERCSRTEDIAVADYIRTVGSPALVLHSPAVDNQHHNPVRRIGSGCSHRIADRVAGTVGTAEVGRTELPV
jgi:hypothetical protein